MRLASFNALHGLSLADGRVSTERLVEACASLDPDVLCLQEVDRGQDRSGGADQVAAIAEGLGARWWRFEPTLVGVPGSEWRPAVGGDSERGSAPAYGVGIVSRREVTSWSVVRLPPARIRAPVAVPGGRGRFVLLPDEPRAALVAEVGELLVATTHLSFVPGHNLRQLRTTVRALAAAEAGPKVLLGDLNLPGALPSWACGWRRLVRARTYPADRPSLQIDHALASGPVAPVRAARVVRLSLSVLRALVVDLEES